MAGPHCEYFLGALDSYELYKVQHHRNACTLEWPNVDFILENIGGVSENEGPSGYRLEFSIKLTSAFMWNRE